MSASLVFAFHVVDYGKLIASHLFLSTFQQTQYSQPSRPPMFALAVSGYPLLPFVIFCVIGFASGRGSGESDPAPPVACLGGHGFTEADKKIKKIK